MTALQVNDGKPAMPQRDRPFAARGAPDAGSVRAAMGKPRRHLFDGIVGRASPLYVSGNSAHGSSSRLSHLPAAANFAKDRRNRGRQLACRRRETNALGYLVAALLARLEICAHHDFGK